MEFLYVYDNIWTAHTPQKASRHGTIARISAASTASTYRFDSVDLLFWSILQRKFNSATTWSKTLINVDLFAVYDILLFNETDRFARRSFNAESIRFSAYSTSVTASWKQTVARIDAVPWNATDIALDVKYFLDRVVSQFQQLFQRLCTWLVSALFILIFISWSPGHLRLSLQLDDSCIINIFWLRLSSGAMK